MPQDLIRRFLPFALVTAAGLVAWSATAGFGFVYDDDAAIVDNAALMAGDWWGAAFGKTCTPLANRPLASLSLCADLAVWGPGPHGPHLTNLLLHLLNGILVLLVVRGVLRAPNLAARVPEARATTFATAVAAIWVAHPLAADAVAYATQRSTLLASCCLLLCLLATLRSHWMPGGRRWWFLAVLAMALGMASKEDMVVGPLLVVLFERAYVLQSWAAMRAAVPRYSLLASSWIVLCAAIALGPRNPTVGYDTVPRVNAWEWLMTQAGVVVHYVRLGVWPVPLRGAYDWGIVRTVANAWLPGLVVLALLAATLASWRRRPWWGWLGAMFFLLLAPTSTVLPIVTEVVAERRVYLPMLAVIVPLVAAGSGALAWLAARRQVRVTRLAGGAAATVVAGLALTARFHSRVYADEATFWRTAFEQLDPHSRSLLAARILSNHAAELTRQGRFAEAHPLLERAMGCEAVMPAERTQYAMSLDELGRHAEALALLEAIVTEAPSCPDALGALGICLAADFERAGDGGPGDRRLVRAEEVMRQAVALAPRRGTYWNTYGYVLLKRNRPREAEAAFRQAMEVSPDLVEPRVNLAELFDRTERSAEIRPMFEQLLTARPQDPDVRIQLAAFAVQRQDRAGAMALLRDALRLDPANAQAAALLRELEAAGRR
jgi:Tfp pilus assembly protein PilF